MIPDFSKPQWFPNRIDEPCKVIKPATIFVGSMCDIFSEGVKPAWIHHILLTVANCPQHTFMFLTKKPGHYKEYTWPENCRLGVTIESEKQETRLREMDELDNLCFASVEPIQSAFHSPYFFSCMDLLIIGADSTPGAVIPPIEWVNSIRENNSTIKIWYKQNLRKYYPQLKND